MKKTIIITAATLALMLGACSSSSNNTEQTTQTFNLDTSKLKSGDVFYQCEMHPEILSEKFGTCPTCQMDLSEIKKK